MASPKKPCKHCSSDKHWPFQCFKRPKKLKPVRKGLGWVAQKWLSTRRAWFAANNASSYHCYICGAYTLRAETTLDHVKPRGSHPELRYELSNLQPSCSPCQLGKGSKSLENYLAERDRLGLPVSDYARSISS